MSIYLQPLIEDDAQSLFQFELENRVFFETMVPTRGNDYYDYPYFQMNHKKLLAEQRDGQSFFYLIKNESGEIVGRMNIIDVTKGRQSAEIGYRVGEAYIGKGIASVALQLAIEEALKLNIKELRAKTTTNNYPSQKVLERNGFFRTFISEEPFEFKGEVVRFVHYSKVIR